MRRGFAWLLSVALLLNLSACGFRTSHVQDGTPVKFYYTLTNLDNLEQGETVQPEDRYLEDETLVEMLSSYLAGPTTDELMSPFPTGTRVLDLFRQGDELTLILSVEFFSLTGVKMSIASCCLANTICGYTDVEKLILKDEMQTISMEVQPDQYLLSNKLQSAEDESFTLYFADNSKRYLVAETRDVTLSDNETPEAYVMRKLIEGPESDQLRPIIPEGTEVLDITTEDSLCTLNLSKDFVDSMRDGTYGAYMTIYGITDTLTCLDGVEAVLFQVEGETLSDYGVFPVERPIHRNTGCIGPVRSSAGEVDINIYALSSEGDDVFTFPCRVKQTVSQPLAQAVAMQVLTYEPPVGFYNPIPYGAELLNVSVSGTTCYIDISEKFVPHEDSRKAEQEAVWSLVMALTALEEVSYVVLTIEGDSTGLSYIDISEPLTRQSVNYYN